ncbi:uncharacterized protein LOC101734364 isoform X2 [Xenopus tropicalis]|uniref:Uncharacterized protein LOC101734364 isoform X2 n=1 Tax=Xenopus tropicalis TaxID=8364 RepID=A0A8J1J336_XENTR|nr:uncharacterized protein LOC101734364 isoform X2 [Xenopus tropicalis]
MISSCPPRGVRVYIRCISGSVSGKMKREAELNLLFILLSVSYGGATERDPQDIFAAEGAPVLFPMQEKLRVSQTQEGECNPFTWQVKKSQHQYRETIARADALCNPVLYEGNYPPPRSNVSHNGSLLLYNLTREDAGKYTVTVDTLWREQWFNKTYILHVQGGATERDPQDIFAAEGAPVLFPMQEKLRVSQTQEGECNQFTWQVKKLQHKYRQTIARADALCNPVLYYGQYPPPRSSVSQNGSLWLYNLTREDAGKYTVTANTLWRAPWFEKSYILHVQVPLSDPVIEVSCESGERAVLSCRVQTGSDPSYTWVTNGAIKRNMIPPGEVNGDRITVPLPLPGGISCTVRNRVTEKRVRLSAIRCPGGATERDPQDIFGAEGAPVLFPMQEKLRVSQTQEGECNQFTWQVKKLQHKYRQTIARADALCNPVLYYGQYPPPRSSVSHNGSLWLYNLTREDAGKYIVTVDTLSRKRWFKQIYLLHVQDGAKAGTMD